MSRVTVIIEPEGGGRFTGRIEMRGDDLLGFEAFAAAGPRREFEFGGPCAAALWVGDRVRITIPEYEFSDKGRVVSWYGIDAESGSVLIRTGHTSPGMTARYVSTTNAMLAQVAAVLEEAIG